MRRFLVRTPASCANLGAGFDALGFALELTNDATVIVDSAGEPGVTVERVEGEGSGLLPLSADNLFVRSMLYFAASVGEELPSCRISVTNRIPLARGMGSSSATIVGGLIAASSALGRNIAEKVETDLILRLADHLEGHADNVAAALYGGLTIAMDSGSKDVRAHRLSPAPQLTALLVIPCDELSTEESRRSIPQQVRLEDAVFNISRATSFVAGLITGDRVLIADGADDRLHQPQRMPLLPFFSDVRRALHSCGVDNVVLSGAGPSMLSLVGIEEADSLVSAVREALGDYAGSLDIRQIPISSRGVTVEELSAERTDSQ